jgi:hypothetical protein
MPACGKPPQPLVALNILWRIATVHLVDSKTEIYRRRAEDAETKANNTGDISAKAMYEEIAAHYRLLTKQQENIDRWARLSQDR